MSESLPKGIRAFVRQGFVTENGQEFETLEEAVKHQELDEITQFLNFHPNIDWRNPQPLVVARAIVDNFDIKRKET